MTRIGGDNTTYGPLLQALRDNRLKGRLSVIIGCETFSAATNFATEVEKDTDAVLVGEPTAGRPNLYGDVRDVPCRARGSLRTSRRAIGR